MRTCVLFVVALAAAGCARYRTEEVVVRSGETALGATLYLPAGRGPHPAVALFGGSGRSTRENLRFFAEFYATHGVAALASDKRDIGPIRATELVSSDELAGDALAGVELLKTRAGIDPRRIGLWGGSQGAGVAARAAARSTDVAFVVAVSGGGLTMAEHRSFQFGNRLRARGFSDAEVAEALRVVERLHDYVRAGGKNTEAMQAELDRAFQHPWAAEVLPRRAPTAEERATWIQWRELDGDPMQDWERLTVPVLLLWGGRDAVVNVPLSEQRIRAALGRAGNRDFTIHVVPDADHNFMLPGAAPTDFPAEDFLNVMRDWTLKRVGKK
jgi:pimeloyl-ACP methyl ester carboxylesterase